MSNIATLQPKTQMGLTPQTIGEAIQLAELMSKSGIVPKDYQGNPGNIIVAIQWGAEIGLPPLQAMQNLAVINGRPALWGDAVIAIVRGSGLLESISEDIGDTSATCTVKRRNEQAVSRTFSMEDAKRAGLSGKQGPWAQYPKRMMQMRARAWALRDVFPDVLRGVHVAEEAQDMPAERDMGAAQIVPEPAVASRTESVKAKLAGKRKPTEPAADLDDVLSAIACAETPEALKAAATLAGKLGTDADKAVARQAYADRKAAIETPPDLELTPPEPADQILAGIARAASAEDAATWLDEAREQGLSDADMARVEAAIEARKS
ncbi:MAG: transcriptional regulator [Gammaproteobacteria bacterium]|nr:transcriptional regulator [Gammaproteobacteria bacterium]